MNELKGFYLEFVNSEAGKDFIKQLAEREMAYQVQAYSAKTMEEKALLVERGRGIYEIRNLLHDLSTPATSTTAKKS